VINPAIKDMVRFAVSKLEAGEIIAYPTDTLYGFGVDATNTEAIQKVNQYKGRTQPMSVILNNVDSISEFAEINKTQKTEIRKLFPGPYTVLLKKKSSVLSELITLESTKIAIRIPNHTFPLEIVKRLKKPIITTSINRHGDEPLNDVSQVAIDFPDTYIFEEEKFHSSKGSTIIDLTENKYKVIRIGDGKYPL